MPKTTICGVCGSALARYPVQRGPATYQVWRHLDTTGLTPHVAVIGVPGHRATVEEMTAALGGDATAASDLWHQLYGRAPQLEWSQRDGRYVETDGEDDVVHIPAPRIPARLARDDEVPTAARTVAKFADEHDWDVKIVYAMGPVIAASGKGVLRENESISVRCHRSGQRVVAVWTKPWSPSGPVMETKRKGCVGCKQLTCEGCAVGPGATETTTPATWGHDQSFLVTPETEVVRLTDLKAALALPEAYCTRCGQVFGLHIPDPERGRICPIQPEEEP